MINNNIARVGNFTSSEIVALMAEPTATAKKTGEKFGKAAYTFIEECNFERRLGRSITTESNARPLTWGKALEANAFELLGLEYTLSSQETDTHPLYNFWAGSKDGIKNDEGKTVFDIKCPMTLKSFCQLVQPIYDGLEGMDAMQKVIETHKEGEKYYWQLVSNAIINNCKFAELIVYVPYESEIPAIKLQADGNSNLYWIAMAEEGVLPCLKNGGYYKNINTIRFEVPDLDKQILTDRVVAASKFLIERPLAK